MATFTVKVTISGTVAGRSVLYTHTGTFTGIEEVVTDAGVVSNTEAVATFKAARRGGSNYTAVEFCAVANVTPNQMMLVEVTGASAIQLWALRGVPLMAWQSHDYDAAFMTDSTTLGPPDEDVTSIYLTGLTGPSEFNAIAFFRPLT